MRSVVFNVIFYVFFILMFVYVVAVALRCSGVLQHPGMRSLCTGGWCAWQVVVSVAEHHSNLVPWQLVCQATGAKLRHVGLTQDTQEIDLEVRRRGPCQSCVGVGCNPSACPCPCAGHDLGGRLLPRSCARLSTRGQRRWRWCMCRTCWEVSLTQPTQQSSPTRHAALLSSKLWDADLRRGCHPLFPAMHAG